MYTKKLTIPFRFSLRSLQKQGTRLSDRILWTLSTLRCLPIDILSWDFDVAGFAVDAILCVDLKAYADVFGVVFDVFVDGGGAEAVFYALVGWVVGLCVFVPIFDLEMHGLVFFVVCSGSRDTGQDVEGDFTVWFWVFDFLVFVCWLGCGGVGTFVFQRPWDSAFEEVGF